MELACVVTPVESYEDITNLLDNHNPHQDEDLISSTGKTGLTDEELWIQFRAKVDIQTPYSVPQPDVTVVTWKEPAINTKVTIELLEVDCTTAQDITLHLDYDKIKNYRLFHFVISKQEIRPLLINITEKVDDVILKVCATFGIDRVEEYSLWQTEGGPLVSHHHGDSQKFKYGCLPSNLKSRPDETEDVSKCKCWALDGNNSLSRQFTFNMKPYILHLSKHSPLEDVDKGEDDTDLGEEWPDFEDVEVARQREFTQCWCGVIQGDYPIEKEVATELAALLLKVYFGKKQLSELFRPSMVQQFLPEMFANCPKVPLQVKEYYEALKETSQSEAIDQVIQTCRKTVTYRGLFFPVQQVEVSKQFLSLKKPKRYIFGVNHQGVIKIDAFSGKVLSVKRFSDIHSGIFGENIFHLNFKKWDMDFYARAEQSTRILEVLRIYIADLTKRNSIQEVASTS